MNWRHGETAFLDVGGRSLECAMWGPAPADAPTVVLLHEGLGCVAMWRDFPTALAEVTGLGVFAFSRAGYGRSDAISLPRPVDYMTEEAGDVLPAVLREAGIQQAVLLGHSDGATIAAIYAGSVPDPRIRGLVLIAPHFFAEEMGLDAIRKARTAFEAGPLREGLARYHRDPDVTFSGWNDVWLSPAFRTWNVADVIDGIKVPVLAIQGREDQYGTLAQIKELTSRCPAPVEVRLPDLCAHAPHLERKDLTLSAISGFLERLEVRPG